MTSVGTLEAKTHLTQLLIRVQKGERILITNRGQPVAMLVPLDQDAPNDVASVVVGMLKSRDENGPTLGKNLTIRKLREEGRRF